MSHTALLSNLAEESLALATAGASSWRSMSVCEWSSGHTWRALEHDHYVCVALCVEAMSQKLLNMTGSNSSLSPWDLLPCSLLQSLCVSVSLHCVL